MFKYILSKVIKKTRLSSVLNSSIHKTSKVESGSNIINTQIDKYSFCGYDCEIINTKIGRFCSIADNVRIGSVNHPINWISTSPVFYKGKDSVKKKFSEHERPKDQEVIIGNDVWIGANVLIKQGVRVGDGAIIGMGSVVTKDIPNYQIFAGNPAKFIRDRFDENIKIELQKIKWWDFDEKKLDEVAKYSNDIIKFIEECKK